MAAVVTRLGIEVENGLTSSAPLTPSILPPNSDSNSQRELPPRTPPNDPKIAPVFVIRDLATEMGVESPSAVRSAQSAPTARELDLIEEGLISAQEAFAMFKMSATFSFTCFRKYFLTRIQ